MIEKNAQYFRGPNKEVEFDLVITKDNLFLPSQKAVLEMILEDHSREEIAGELKISEYTVVHHLFGIHTHSLEEESPEELLVHNRAEIGISGIVEAVSGKHPNNMPHLIWLLLESKIVYQQKRTLP